MTTQTRTHRRAAALLLTAAALSLTPAYAQEAQPPVDEPVADTAPVPQPVESVPPAPAPSAEPVAATPQPTPAPAPVVETQQAPPAARAARTTRAAPRAATRAPARAAPAQAAAPAPAAVAPAPLPAETAPPAPAAEALPPPVTLPETPAAAPPAQPEESGGSILPWLIAGLLAAGALAFFLLRRRRAPVEREAYAYDEPVRDPVGAAVQETPRQPVAAAVPAALAWQETPHEPAAAAAPVEEGIPSLDFELRPRRAGVTGTEAVVEFDLGVANHGSAAARDVRVSTWMFPAGAEQSSEAERALIDRSGDADLHDIGAGDGESISRSVTLPTSSVGGDAVLPMVVAEARYRLPDGSEARTSATYAVGVPDGDELAHFAIDNPSGLHDEVVAWELGKTEPA
jgi:hypothetical protein